MIEDINVRVGSSEHKRGGTMVKLKGFPVQHPGYEFPSNDYDFSLLELAEPLAFSDQIQSIALPEANDIIRDGIMSSVSGWGNVILLKCINCIVD